MINYIWKIKEVCKDGDLITSALYLITAQDGDNIVQTEGHCYFANPNLKIPYLNVTEKDIINWIYDEIGEEGILNIKANLEIQIDKTKNIVKSDLPWLANTFKPNL